MRPAWRSALAPVVRILRMLPNAFLFVTLPPHKGDLPFTLQCCVLLLQHNISDTRRPAGMAHQQRVKKVTIGCLQMAYPGRTG